MVNFPGPIDEQIGLAALVVVLESCEAYVASVNYTATLARGIRDAAEKVGYRRFARLWIPWRLLVSLQVRLFVETVMFSMGKPWSELVSGFKPLRMNLKSIVTGGEL